MRVVSPKGAPNILPVTCRMVTGIPAPNMVDGIAQTTIEGVGLA